MADVEEALEGEEIPVVAGAEEAQEILEVAGEALEIEEDQVLEDID